jgi:hypothetical protein
MESNAIITKEASNSNRSGKTARLAVVDSDVKSALSDATPEFGA